VLGFRASYSGLPLQRDAIPIVDEKSLEERSGVEEAGVENSLTRFKSKISTNCKLE
jgi:hypothetical protein